MVVMAAFAVNMGRGALGAALRPRADGNAVSWALLWGAGALSIVLGLVIEYGEYRLLWVVPAAGLAVIAHVGMSRIKTTRRFDRTLAGELFAPTAYFGAGGASYAGAGLIWLVAAAQSVSGILHVRAIIGSLRLNKEASPPPIHGSAVISAMYHGLVLVGLMGVGHAVPDRTAAFALVAYVPLLVRSVFGFRRRTRAPQFTRIGIGETLMSLWCAGWTAAALQVSGLT